MSDASPDKVEPINEITGAIINAAIEVHKELGPGLLERIYEDALSYELSSRKIDYERQKILPVPYKDTILQGQFRLDLLIEEKVIVELKNCDQILPIHEAQVLTYLKITGHKVGLILNFNAPLMRHGIKRIILS